MSIRERKRIWKLMFRKEGNQKVWVYEPLRRKEINNREKHGWKVLM